MKYFFINFNFVRYLNIKNEKLPVFKHFQSIKSEVLSQHDPFNIFIYYIIKFLYLKKYIVPESSLVQLVAHPSLD